MRTQLGESVVNALKEKIDRVNFAITRGGDQAAEQLGKDLGEVMWQVGSVVTGVVTVAKGGVALAKVGLNVGSDALKAMAATSTTVIAEMKIASALPGAAKSVEELSAQTSAGLKAQYAAKPANAYTIKAQADKAGASLTAVPPAMPVVAVGAATGKVLGAFSAIDPGPLLSDVAGTFAGGQYQVVELLEDATLYRSGVSGKPLGQYFSTEPADSVLRTRIDKAVLPVWPTGAVSPLDTSFAVKIPAGTHVYVGVVGAQGGMFVGGTEQIVVIKPWDIPGVKVIASKPLK